MPDAGRAGDAAQDAGPASPFTVPMFVAVGYGGRRIMSCDLGRSWVADQRIAETDGEHEVYTPKSLAYGAGTFVFLTGWGVAESRAHVTTDGVNWQTQVLDKRYASVGFVGDRFVLVGAGGLAESTDNAQSWTPRPEPGAPHERGGGAFEGIFAAGADAIATFLRPGDPEWRAVASCVGARHGGIGQSGGFAASGGRLVSVGEYGDTCGVDIATGAELPVGKFDIGENPGDRQQLTGNVAVIDGAFQVAASGRIHSSADGVAWTSRVLPDGVRFDLIARAPSGAYVGVSESGPGNPFFYSDDGQAWQPGQGPDAGELSFQYLAFGYVAPSATCPR